MILFTVIVVYLNIMQLHVFCVCVCMLIFNTSMHELAKSVPLCLRLLKNAGIKHCLICHKICY